MRIIKDIDNIHLSGSVVTTGNFDGVHLGHRFLLEQLVAKAREMDVPAVVVMFSPHPRQILRPQKEPFLYLTSEQKQIELLEDCGVDLLVKVPFTKAMAAWSAEDFITKILLTLLNVKFYLIGYDHHLGNPKYSTDLQKIATKYGFEMYQSLPYEGDKGLVSSTAIRNALALGDVALAAEFLGRDYGFRCKVVGGKRIGRTIGYPTANLVPLFDQILLPADGVYAVNVKIDEFCYGGMMQLGHRPTLNDNRGLTLEVHIFDFNKDIYDYEILLSFKCFIRKIVKFDHIDALVSQLQKDEKTAKALLG